MGYTFHGRRLPSVAGVYQEETMRALTTILVGAALLIASEEKAAELGGNGAIYVAREASWQQRGRDIDRILASQLTKASR